MKVASTTKVSVIICTRNRCSSLSRTLQTIAALDLSGLIGFELIVVDNGSSDATRKVVSAFQAEAAFEVHYLLEIRPGLSLARNCGLDAATGTLIMFTDDDCLVLQDWVKEAVSLIGSKPLQVIGGRVELHNPTHLEETVKTSVNREIASVNSIFGFIMGANIIFGRAVVDQIGQFDQRFGVGTPLRAAEDTEFVYRALITGIPVSYEPSMVVRHDHVRSCVREHFKINRNYSIGDGALAMQYVLSGRTDLLRPLYWGLRRSFRDRSSHPLGLRWPLAKLLIFEGALRYLLFASWRRGYGMHKPVRGGPSPKSLHLRTGSLARDANSRVHSGWSER